MSQNQNFDTVRPIQYVLDSISEQKQTVVADIKIQLDTMASPGFSLSKLEKAGPPATVTALLGELICLCRSRDIVNNAEK